MSISTIIWVEIIQAGIICSAIAVYHHIAKNTHYLHHSIDRQANTKAQLQAVKSSSESCSKFIENIAKSLREPSQEIFDAAKFLNDQSVAKNRENIDSRENNEKAIEQGLLSSAKKLHQLCNNIVDYTHLKKGSVSLVEQEIDPVELIRFCVASFNSHPEEKNNQAHTIEFDEKLDNRWLITGDLAKLKVLLLKLFGSAINHVQKEDDNNRVKVSLWENDGMAVSVKLSGYHLNTLKFKQLCSPQNNEMEQFQELDLDLAIAKQLAQLHGGDLIIQEHSPLGTVLAFCLPAGRIIKIESQSRQSTLGSRSIY